MRLFKNIWKKQTRQSQVYTEVTGKCIELLQWENFVDQLRRTDHYISRKEYMSVVNKYSEVMNFFKSLDENDLLTEYCGKNGFTAEKAKEIYLTCPYIYKFSGSN